MNKITEEILTNLIKRIEVLENTKKPVRPAQNTNLATSGQINYLQSLGGTAYSGMTKQIAGNLIDKLIKEKKIRETEQTIEPVTLEIPASKPLTPQEIEELGEGGLL